MSLVPQPFTPPRRAHIVGLGIAVPPQVLTNDDLAQRMDTTDEWIRTRTGIRERRVSTPDIATSDLATQAGRMAIADAGITAESLDLILCATTSGDYIWPSTACILQQNLGATRAAAFDLSAACSGFCYALATAAAYIESGSMKQILVVGADTLTKQVNWSDRGTCILFGDGAGAAILAAGPPDAGVVSSIMRADGSGVESVWLPAGGTRTPITTELLEAGNVGLEMRGREVYRFAAERVPEVIMDALCSVGLNPSDVGLLVMHQANLRIMQTVSERLNIPMEKVFVNLDRYGNTSAASVPMALCEAKAEGRILPGDVVVTVGFGAGLTWAANVIFWQGAANG